MAAIVCRNVLTFDPSDTIPPSAMAIDPKTLATIEPRGRELEKLIDSFEGRESVNHIRPDRYPREVAGPARKNSSTDL